MRLLRASSRELLRKSYLLAPEPAGTTLESSTTKLRFMEEDSTLIEKAIVSDAVQLGNFPI
jgi:hypothetical protein